MIIVVVTGSRDATDKETIHKEANSTNAPIVCLAFPVEGAKNPGTFGCIGLARNKVRNIEVRVTKLLK